MNNEINTPLKSELHHWWPRCVSARWNDNEGAVNWIKPNGKMVRSPAKNFGAIGNGHHFKADREGKPNPWDHSFEHVFSDADDKFPALIDWLQGLECKHTPLRSSRKEGFLAQKVDEKMLLTLVECIVSLVVRSPKFRETGAALAERFRGPLDAHERNGLISANIMHCQRRIADSIGTCGKFAVLFTHDREFLYGDGFYHNLSSQTQNRSGVRIVAPITPNVAVFYSCPNSYRTDPSLVTLMLTDDEVTFFNQTVQIYARDKLFFRNEKPELLDVYRIGDHRIYGASDPMDIWVQDFSGVDNKIRGFHF
ncbi:MAG: DUF4238 domain-containing protein [Rhodobacteraceae bacterium]|nr:DUF4238 domain-containing protein [Paracoccaceae bacterium]